MRDIFSLQTFLFRLRPRQTKNPTRY